MNNLNFTDRFYLLSEEMSSFLQMTSIEVLVSNGFKVGTAVKISSYSEVDLVNTTIHTLRELVRVIENERVKEGIDPVIAGQLTHRFDSFLEDLIYLIVSIPPCDLLEGTYISSSTISNIRSKGLEGNYQTRKLLMVADRALEVNQ